MPFRRNLYYLLIITSLCLPGLLSATVLPYAGATVGSSESQPVDQFETDLSGYFFIGIQTDYYVTYELGISYFEFNTFEGAPSSRHASFLTATALGHLPIGDSSIFIRAGISGYEYFDNNDEQQDVFVPTYGFGFDYAIKPRISLRLEWQRYMDLEYNRAKFDIDSVRAGFFVYF